jgi:hypothetical protein
MHRHPDDERAIREAFDSLVNLTPAELAAWLETPQSRRVGMTRPGETESVGRQSARRILQILATPADDLSDAELRPHEEGDRLLPPASGATAAGPSPRRRCRRDPLAVEPDELGPRPAERSKGRMTPDRRLPIFPA